MFFDHHLRAPVNGFVFCTCSLLHVHRVPRVSSSSTGSSFPGSSSYHERDMSDSNPERSTVNGFLGLARLWIFGLQMPRLTRHAVRKCERKRGGHVPATVVRTNVEAYRKCIDECIKCMEACEQCLSSCLREPDVAARQHCIGLLRDCADICALATRYMTRASSYAKQLCQICADICDACAVECERFQDDHCTECARSCRTCAAECRKMAGQTP